MKDTNTQSPIKKFLKENTGYLIFLAVFVVYLVYTILRQTGVIPGGEPGSFSWYFSVGGIGFMLFRLVQEYLDFRKNN